MVTVPELILSIRIELMTERETRKKLIDPHLQDAGWIVVPYREQTEIVKFTRHAIEEYPTANGPADYVLVNKGEIIAVVEAKKVEVGTQSVLNQAKRYALGIEKNRFDFSGYKVPFLYSTNGFQTWFEDVRRIGSRSREIAGFHTPQALDELMQKEDDQSRQWLRYTPNDHVFLRPYQFDAIQSIESALLSNKRRMLVAMATGTGKTYTAISLLYRFLKSGFAKRILFLVDRRALAAQAVSAAGSFEVEPGIFERRISHAIVQDARGRRVDRCYFVSW